MILLSVLKKLEQDGVGTIDVDLFYEMAAVDADGKPKPGMWIVARGNQVSRLDVGIQSFDIFTRYSDKLLGSQKAQQILEKLQDYFGQVCDLDAVPPYTTQEYKRVRIIPTTGIDSIGADDQDRMVYAVSGEVRYTKNND